MRRRAAPLAPPPAPVCPGCGCACDRCGRPEIRGYVPAFINTVDPKLRSRDILVVFTNGGKARDPFTSRAVADIFGVTIADASHRLRTLARTRALRTLRRSGQSLVYEATDYGLLKAKEYAER